MVLDRGDDRLRSEPGMETPIAGKGDHEPAISGFVNNRGLERALPEPAERLDLAQAWSKLTPGIQQRIGMSALALAFGALGERQDAGPPQGFAAAYLEGENALLELVDAAVAADFVRLPLPDLWSLGIQNCRECGCVDACACPEGCAWIEADLCSACAHRLPAFTVEVSHSELKDPVLGVFHGRTPLEAADNAARAAFRELVQQTMRLDDLGEDAGADDRQALMRQALDKLEQLVASSSRRVWSGRFGHVPARPYLAFGGEERQ